MKSFRERLMAPLEKLLELGGTKKDIVLLVLSGIAVLCSLAGVHSFPFDIAWVAIVLCGVPIILEAIIGLVTAFDIKADVLVSLALIASVCIGETFAAGEVAFIMQLGGLLEELTVAKARVGEDSSLQRMIRLVQSADAGKAKIVGLADRWATWIVVIALTAAATTWALTGQILHGVSATVTYLAADGVFAGYIALSDTLRPESAATIRALAGLNVQPMLLTGDHESAANAIAARLGITQVRANCLPQDKLQAMEACQNAGQPVCMIGDGINDAPALKKADVSIAMGGTGILNPVVGALVHNAGSVLVIVNSALLLNWRKKV